MKAGGERWGGTPVSREKEVREADKRAHRLDEAILSEDSSSYTARSEDRGGRSKMSRSFK